MREIVEIFYGALIGCVDGAGRWPTVIDRTECSSPARHRTHCHADDIVSSVISALACVIMHERAAGILATVACIRFPLAPAANVLFRQ